MIDPNKVMDDAQHLLKKAVNILEEEIAAGILAAKRVEKKVINVDEMRDTDPEELMSRIRRDTHDAIDIFMDAFTALTRHFGGLTETLNRTKPDPLAKNTGNGHPNGSQQQAAPAIPVVRTEKPAKPGTAIEIPIVLSNDSEDRSIVVALSRSELIGPGGTKIPAKLIKLTPRSFTLEPLQKKEVLIKINIPDTCKKGSYSSLIQDDSNPDIRVIITVDVDLRRGSASL